MKTIQEIKEEAQKMYSKVSNECGLFWAFSDEQFNENKTPLKKGEKYVSIGAGGYLPKGNINNLLEGWENVEKWRKKETKLLKDATKAILFEINNFEAFLSNDLSPVFEVFKGIYSEEIIRDVYNKYYHTFNF